ncbi:MAG TPA: hypothetical protein VNL14_06260 [Candidatus Acidoferrales bacterium]|nr:hypothetical protein [Candidatus Acidoferrales bacterium]
MAEEARVISMEPERRESLVECNWEELTEPGAYVEKGTGDLYRVPKEALLQGGSPVITKQSAGASRLVRISKDPFITTFKARMLCAEHNIKPNF